jgi:hypothetical protein
MNFNHLMESHFAKRKCKDRNDPCYFLPIGNVRSTAGANVHLTMRCKNCGAREDIFLSKEDYLIQQKLIHKEINHV